MRPSGCGDRRHEHAQFRRSDQAQRGRAAADAARRCSSTTSSCPACCMPPSCAATSRMPASARSMCRRRAAAPGWSPSIPPPTSATTGSRGRCWCRRRRSQDIDLQPAHPGAARQGQGPPCRRAARDRARREPLPRRGRARRYRGRSRAAAGRGRSRKGAERRIAAGPRRCALQRRRACPAEPRATMPPRGAKADRVIARRFLYDHGTSSPIETRGIVAQLGCARQSAHGLGHDAGAGVRPQRARRHARPERAAGARDRAVRRRRLRAEDHDVLSRGGAAAVGGDAAQPAGQMDRGSAGAFLRHHAGARPDP